MQRVNFNRCIICHIIQRTAAVIGGIDGQKLLYHAVQQFLDLSECVGASDKCRQVNKALGFVGCRLVGLFLELTVHCKAAACRD